MHTLTAKASSSLSLPPNSYIYSLTPSSPGSFAAISSDDSLRIFDASRGSNLGDVSVISPRSHKNGVTSLKSYTGNNQQQLLVTGGRDGMVRIWDARNRSKDAVVEMRTAKNAPVLSVACNPPTSNVVAGTEIVSSQAVVAFWDIRSPKEARLQYTDSHNDDITELQYHPTQNHILLSGSTDGLVNTYDSRIPDENDALLQVINHGSVHHAGFLDQRTIYALSHDETFSIHPATDPDEPKEEPQPIQFGDLREPLGCEYVAQLCTGGQGPFIAAGNKAEKRLDLIPLLSSPSWRFDQNDLWRLPGAHGEEVVRSVYLDEQSQTVFTCGEDGFVRAWRSDEVVHNGPDAMQTDPPASASASPSSDKSRAKGKKQKERKDRFKPY